MNNTFKSIALTILTLALGAAPAVSQKQQRQLPEKHNQAHTQLLANQRTINTEFGANVVNRSVAALQEREAIEAIFSTCWDSQSVNPYGSSVSIPATAEIDVAEGVVPVRSRVSSPYGWRSSFGRMHKGVDLTLHVGDTVRSAFTGKVRLTKFEGKGYGNYVVVRHNNGLETVYGHLSRFLVKPGQTVKAGQPIALGGNTGRSTGPHLHFETRYLGLPVNPEWIFDFAHNTTIKDTYTFDHDQYRAAQVSRGAKSSKGLTASAKSKKSTTTTRSKRRSRR